MCNACLADQQRPIIYIMSSMGNNFGELGLLRDYHQFLAQKSYFTVEAVL